MGNYVKKLLKVSRPSSDSVDPLYAYPRGGRAQNRVNGEAKAGVGKEDHVQ